jgi:hypothetical protein
MACRQIICVLGMHRSGSSLLAQIMHRNGIAIGTNLVGKSAHNPDGHFEDRFILQINKKILIHFGGTWDRPAQLPGNWLEDPFVKRLLSKARAYRHEEIDQYDRFFFKDPRTCLLVPFWHSAFGDMLYVVILRHQDSVVRSIVTRNREWMKPSQFWWRWGRKVYHRWQGAYEQLAPIVVEQARQLWTLYNDCIVRYTEGLPVAVITYERLLAEPEITVRALMQRIDPTLDAALGDIIKTSLDHGKKPEESPEELAYYRLLTERKDSINGGN